MIDLDPCAEPERNVPALAHYTEQEDGLSQRWFGNVYMNPPYGSEIPLWIERFVQHIEAGNTGIALLPARVGSRWWNMLADAAGLYVCFLSGRLRFSGSLHSAPFPSAIVYAGDNADLFIRVFQEIGQIWVRIQSGGEYEISS